MAGGSIGLYDGYVLEGNLQAGRAHHRPWPLGRWRAPSLPLYLGHAVGGKLRALEAVKHVNLHAWKLK